MWRLNCRLTLADRWQRDHLAIARRGGRRSFMRSRSRIKGSKREPCGRAIQHASLLLMKLLTGRQEPCNVRDAHRGGRVQEGVVQVTRAAPAEPLAIWHLVLISCVPMSPILAVSF